MKKTQILGLVRHALTVGGGYFIAKGTLDEGTVNEIVGAIMTLIGTSWSFVSPEKKDA